jgi:hypothetical protein
MDEERDRQVACNIAFARGATTTLRPFQNRDKRLAGTDLSRCSYASVEILLNQASSLPPIWNGLQLGGAKGSPQLGGPFPRINFPAQADRRRGPS